MLGDIVEGSVRLSEVVYGIINRCNRAETESPKLDDGAGVSKSSSEGLSPCVTRQDPSGHAVTYV